MKMTKIFIEEYKSSGGASKCPSCHRPAMKSMCDVHLRKAKIAFRHWTKERLVKCLCIKCNKRSHIVHRSGEHRQGVYCTKHREYNRLKILYWMRANHDRIVTEKNRRIKLGVCVQNPEHGETHGHLRCQKCRDKYNLIRRIEKKYAKRSRN